jgi:Sulfotransferase domain
VSALPNLLIIGAAKSGTTSLHSYLALHPQVFMSERKELKLFDRPDWRDRLDWYRAQFPTDAPVRGESSPTYTAHPWFPGVPERIREAIPEARLVYLVRDPVERLVAQYVEMYALRFENRALDEALADFASPRNRVVMGSRYAYQLDRYREAFPDEQILVLDQRDLLDDRRRTLREAFAFVGVDPGFDTPEFDRVHNVREGKRRMRDGAWWLYERNVLLPAWRRRRREMPAVVRDPIERLISVTVPKPSLDPALRAELKAYLHEDADRLRAYTGRDFAHWSV